MNFMKLMSLSSCSVYGICYGRCRNISWGLTLAIFNPIEVFMEILSHCLVLLFGIIKERQLRIFMAITFVVLMKIVKTEKVWLSESFHVYGIILLGTR